MSKRITVKVHPRAKIDRVEQKTADHFEVWTTAPPDKGKANEAVRKLVAKVLGVAPSHLELVRGASAREKIFEVQ